MRKRVLVVGGVLALLFGTLAAVGAFASGGEAGSVDLEMQAGRNVNAITYSIIVHNNTSSALSNVYVSGLVPSGTKFEKATTTPAGAGLIGATATVAGWVVNNVPAGGSVGPIQYTVTATGASVGANHAWSRWLNPKDGSAVSSDVRADYPLIGMKSVSFRANNTEAYPEKQVAITLKGGYAYQNSEKIVTSGLNSVGVGSYAYMESRDTDALGEKVTAYSWQITAKPFGSGAAIEIPTAQSVRFKADKIGKYIVRLTATNAKGQPAVDEIEVYAGEYAGASLCASCHDGSVAQDMVSSWKETGHATKFEVTYGSYTGERDYCVRCHTVGYDEADAAGGIDDAARAAGWNPAKDGSFLHWVKDTKAFSLADIKSDVNMSQMINVQCESCHGPGGNAHTQAKTFNDGTCTQCHPQQQQWKESAHAKKTGYNEIHMAEGTSCVECHTGQGFVQVAIRGKKAIFPNQATATEPATLVDANAQPPIACATCHDPHAATYPFKAADGSLKSLQLRVEGDVAMPNGVTVDAEESAVCVKCHANRRDVTYKAEYLAGSRARSTHDNTQADIFYGVGQFTFGSETYVNSVHPSLITEGCVTCHMAANPVAGPGPDGKAGTSDDVKALSVGGHSWNMEADWEGKPVANTAVCAQCHAGLNTFNRTAAGDYDGDGKIEGVQDEVKGLLAVLAAKLPKDASGVVLSSTISATNTTELQRKALWNYYLVNNDGSNGVHNTSFAVQVLQKTYKALTGSDVPGAKLR
ncbi:MAG: cytochrome c3 family protein [Chloroflexi bacterium]|nr:cytochrome c3 family protein [Chloroflexota bacterium]